MITTLTVLGHTIIQATRHEEFWDITVTDTISGGQDTLTLSDLYFGAIMALAIGGEDYPTELINGLYAIAEPVIAHLPINLRPIQ